jgi:large subunit ribosomal protein L10
MVKQNKIDAVEKLVEKLKKAKSIVITDYRGLTVSQITDLRKKLRAENIEYRVLKNRLTKIALDLAGCDPLDEVLVGPSALAFGYDDPVPPARIIYEFAKKHKNLSPKGGLLGTKRIDLPTLERLSKLPSKEALLGRLLGSLQSPATKVAYGLNQVSTKLVYALKALQEKKEA